MSRVVIAIHAGPLPTHLLHADELVAPARGALCSFVGVVRNQARGRPVVALDYQCYHTMAEKVLAGLAAEARERFDADLGVILVHGTGLMIPGDVSVVIHVASAHRAAAFDACRHLIERLKQDVPIWKHERYADGTSAWLQGS